MQPAHIDRANIKGWSVDADPHNDPTFPMKHRNNAEHAGYSWDRPTQQSGDVEILHSNERPNLTAVFGTSTPPSGLSGIIRRFAFRYSESSYAHWLPLMLADRINMLEGVVDDLAHGHVPNVLSERGWKAEWKHNRRSLVVRTLIGVAATGVAITYLRNRSAARER